MFRSLSIFSVLLCAGCPNEPVALEPDATDSATGEASTGIGEFSSTSDTGMEAADSTGSETGPDDSGGGCAPAVFGTALFDSTCFQ